MADDQHFRHVLVDDTARLPIVRSHISDLNDVATGRLGSGEALKEVVPQE